MLPLIAFYVTNNVGRLFLDANTKTSQNNRSTLYHFLTIVERPMQLETYIEKHY